MAGWNGSGTYSRYHDWTTDEAGAVDIDATRMDQEDDAIAAGINACLTKNGENTPSANLPMGNYKHTGVGAGTALTHYADVASVQNSGYHYAATSGTDTYTITLSPAPAAYATGQRFLIKIGSANTGAATINVNSLGAKSLVKGVSTALVAGDLLANKFYVIVYDGTNFQVEGVVTYSESIDIDGGTVDGAVIGGASAAAITGTVVTASTNFAGPALGLTYPENAQVGTTYTLAASDAGKMVTCSNGSAITVTVDGSLFTTAQVVCIAQKGAGQVTIAAGTATLRSRGSLLKTAGQYAIVTLWWISATEAYVFGDLSA